MNAPPDWQDGECCFRCRTQFTLVARKHHCRNCGNIFCAKCSSQQIPLPKLNIEKNVRVCDTCYEKIARKNEDPLTLALSSKDKESKTDSLTKRKSQTNSKLSSSSENKSGSSASAPSEQELKEEEELQLALALSLSETPTKVSFPDYRHLEESQNTVPAKASASTSNDRNASLSAEVSAPKTSSSVENSSASNHTYPTVPITNSGIDSSAIYSSPVASTTSHAVTVTQQAQQAQPDYHVHDRDHELFKHIGEVHGTLEVFINRLEACKLRNKPVSNDAAIQSLFIKLNSEIQPKLTEYIKTYEDERAVYERLQDKLSEIADARAALDALREEHQDKMRQMAAEAEKQRQSQLASKLEAMRQKKTQMMQYQRELAMQRIREQEMMYQSPAQQQQTTNSQDIQPATSQTPTSIIQPPLQQHWHTDRNVQHQQPYAAAIPQSQNSYVPPNILQQVPQVPYNNQYNTFIPQQTVPVTMQSQQPQPSIDRAAIAQLEKQFLPDAKSDEEAPLISFDD